MLTRYIVNLFEFKKINAKNSLEALLIIAALGVIFYFFRNRLRRDVYGKTEKYQSPDDIFNAKRREREREIDRLLAKMGKNGTDDLSKKDRARLDELSKK